MPFRCLLGLPKPGRRTIVHLYQILPYITSELLADAVFEQVTSALSPTRMHALLNLGPETGLCLCNEDYPCKFLLKAPLLLSAG
jgi:hypothetical protein